MFANWFSAKKVSPSGFENLRQQLALCISVIKKIAPEDYWLRDLSGFKERADGYSERDQITEWNQLGKDVICIYGAMGSFNDNLYPDSVRKLQGALFTAAEDVVRLTRKELGGTWFDIPISEKLKVGDKVVLIKGETISLLRDETPQRAPQSPMIYSVVGMLPNDIDNMPRYHIKADSHVRYARHSALSKTVP